MELSIEQRILLSKILENVKSIMVPDPDFGFVDNGNFLLQLDKEEMRILKKLIKTL